MPDLTNLIARVEAAIGPDRDLDAEIAAELKIVPDFWPKDYIVPLVYRAREDRYGWVGVWAIHLDGTEHLCHSREAPRFTASVDDALTLIPPGWDVRHTDSNGGQWCLTLGRGDDNHPSYREVNSWPGDTERAIFNRRPLPLAICIAAMKARMA